MRSTISDAIKNSLKIYNEIISIRKKLTAQMTYPLILIAQFKKIVALGYLIQQKYRNDIRNMLP